MDTRDGSIRTAEQVAAMRPDEAAHHRPMAVAPTPGQLATGKIGRNDPCPCGSGAKFKRCCLGITSRGQARLVVPRSIEVKQPSPRPEKAARG